MPSKEEKKIELSKVKIILLTFCAIVFVAGGILLLTTDAETIKNSRRLNSPTLIYGIGIASIVFFGLGMIVLFKKLFDKSPGLILNQEGITDNSSGVSAGFIPWSEVVAIRESQVQRQKFVSVIVRDPEKYINRGNALKRITNRVSLQMCDTPINITANSLKIGYAELLATIEEYFKNSRSNI